MSNMTLLLGDSGCGKSTSLRNLPPEQTVIINVLDKPLPFAGWKKNYTTRQVGDRKPNYFASDKSSHICKAIKQINDTRPDIRYLIIDDYGSTMSNEYMRRGRERGFDKYQDLAVNFYEILDAASKVREDLYCVLTMHPELLEDGTYKPKTQGKMFSKTITIESYFTYVFYALIVDDEYKFLTNNDGHHMAKTPMGMFSERFIDNDLAEVFKIYDEFNGITTGADNDKND